MTNEAPQKIYIQSFNVNEEDAKFERLLYFDDIWTEEPEPGQENIEYTRTDAFIEKAIEWLKKSITNNPECNRIISLNGTVTMGMLIEDFKNYMKGE